MRISSLVIHRFRNLSDISLEVSPLFNGFWGQNGQGKSNLIEAVFVALKGRSFRPYANKQDWIPNEQNTLALKLWTTNDENIQHECKIEYTVDKGWKTFLDGKKISTNKLKNFFPVIVFSPDDHLIIRGSPEVRRNFLDNLFGDVCPGYVEVLHHFEKTLSSRNKILKKSKEMFGRAKKLDHGLQQELQSWDQVFVNKAAELTQLRIVLFRELRQYFRDSLVSMAPDLATGIHMELLSELAQSCEADGQNYQDKMQQLLEDSLMLDCITGWTHKGPHRDDLGLELQGAKARAQSSQGQARLLALALKWTHFKWLKSIRNETPVFMLDDLSSELDARRRKSLIEYIKETSGQVFVTGTDATIIENYGLNFDKNFELKQGKISLIQQENSAFGSKSL